MLWLCCNESPVIKTDVLITVQSQSSAAPVEWYCAVTLVRLQSAPCSNIYNVQCACGSQVGWAAPPYWGLGPGNWCLCIESLRRCASVFLYYCARTCVHRSAVDAQARPVVRYHQEVFVHGLTETSSVQLRRDHSGHLPWMTQHNTTQHNKYTNTPQH